MEKRKNRRLGVLMLADVVDYTKQAKKLGDEHTRRFNERFEKITLDLSGKYKGAWIKRIGDAVLIFMAHPEVFIEFALGLRTLSKERKIDCGDFFADLRLWDIDTGQCLKTIDLPWIPNALQINPAHPQQLITANRNCTLSSFDLREW